MNRDPERFANPDRQVIDRLMQQIFEIIKREGPCPSEVLVALLTLHSGIADQLGIEHLAIAMYRARIEAFDKQQARRRH